jgi:hypothetical protein
MFGFSVPHREKLCAIIVFLPGFQKGRDIEAS